MSVFWVFSRHLLLQRRAPPGGWHWWAGCCRIVLSSVLRFNAAGWDWPSRVDLEMGGIGFGSLTFKYVIFHKICIPCIDFQKHRFISTMTIESKSYNFHFSSCDRNRRQPMTHGSKDVKVVFFSAGWAAQGGKRRRRKTKGEGGKTYGHVGTRWVRPIWSLGSDERLLYFP